MTIEEALAGNPHELRLVPIYEDGWIVDYEYEITTSPLVPSVRIVREQELTLF